MRCIILALLFAATCFGDIVQRSSSEPGILIESVSQVTLDRPWVNTTGGLICETSQRSFSDLWSYSASRMLKTTNFSFVFPMDNPIVITGVYVSWRVSITRKPYLGVRESKVSLFLPNRTLPINTRVQVYPTTVGEDGWQVVENVISYPLINESSLWNVAGGIKVEEIMSPAFGVGLTVQNGASDTRAMVGCVLVSVAYDIILPTTTAEPTTTSFFETVTSTLATMFTTKGASTSTKKPKTTKRTSTKPPTTTPNKVIDEKEASGQTIIALIIVSILVICLLVGCVMVGLKQHKKWRAKLAKLSKTNRDYQKLSEVSLQEITKLKRNHFLQDVQISTQQLGAGTTGVVYLGSMDNGATTVACKMYYPSFQQYIREEIVDMLTLKHVNLVQLMGLFEDAKLKIVVVMEYFSRGSLVDFFDTADMKSWFSENRDLHSLNVCLSVAKVMLYLEKKDVVHGNLSPKNVMIEIKDDMVIAKVSDYWMGRDSPSAKNKTIKSSTRNTIKISSDYPVAPEITEYADEKYSKFSDVYSFGYLIHFIYVLGDVPETKQDKELAMKGKPHDMPDVVFKFQQRCHLKIAQERPDFAEAVNFFHTEYSQQELSSQPDYEASTSVKDRLISDLKQVQSSPSKSNINNNVVYSKFEDV